MRRLFLLAAFSFIWGCGTCTSANWRFLPHPDKTLNDAGGVRVCLTCDENKEKMCVNVKKPVGNLKTCLDLPRAE